MDDKNFSRAVAATWISLIESDAALRRIETLYPRLNGWMEKTGTGDVLDIGCGQGICARYLNLAGRRYHGIDASPALIERAQQVYADETRCFSVADAYKLPFATSSFGAAFSVSLWHLLSDLETAISETFRVLGADGHLFVVMANSAARLYWTKPYFDVLNEDERFEGRIFTANGQIERDVIYFRPLPAILDLLEKSGFTVGSVEEFSSQGAGSPGMFLAITAQKLQPNRQKETGSETSNH